MGSVSLKDARETRDAARDLLIDGHDPAITMSRRAVKAAPTFGAVAAEYLEKIEAEGQASVTMSKAKWFLAYLAAGLAAKEIAALTPVDVLTELRKVSMGRKPRNISSLS